MDWKQTKGKEGRKERGCRRRRIIIFQSSGQFSLPTHSLPPTTRNNIIYHLLSGTKNNNTHYCSLFTIVTISRLKMNQSPSIASTLSIVVFTFVLTSILTFTSAQEVVHLDDSNFKEMTAGKIVFIKFYAPW